MYSEAYELCDIARNMAIEYNRMKILPCIIYLQAGCNRQLGRYEKAKDLTLQALYCALSMDDEHYANIIRKHANAWHVL